MSMKFGYLVRQVAQWLSSLLFCLFGYHRLNRFSPILYLGKLFETTHIFWDDDSLCSARPSPSIDVVDQDK